jgi:thioredoxin-related protein
MKKLITIIILAILAPAMFAQSTPESASAVLNKAVAKAAKENKNVMIVFHASWCGWCKKFEASVNDPLCKDFFNKNFVIEYLTILERDEKTKKLENPGAEDLFNKTAGKDQGIPFFLIYDKTGKLVGDSRMKTIKNGAEILSNMGCPTSNEEVAAFIQTLKKVTTVSDREAGAISERFRKNKS